jgi:hypothetical protein
MFLRDRDPWIRNESRIRICQANLLRIWPDSDPNSPFLWPTKNLLPKKKQHFFFFYFFYFLIPTFIPKFLPFFDKIVKIQIRTRNKLPVISSLSGYEPTTTQKPSSKSKQKRKMLSSHIYQSLIIGTYEYQAAEK